MDALSPAASVRAVIEVPKEVYSSCQKYYLGVKHAKDKIRRLSTKLLALGDLLGKVAELANETDGSRFATLKRLDEPNDTFQQCGKELKDIRDELEPTDGTRKFGARALDWPYKSERVSSAIAALERCKSTFELDLTTDHVAITVNVDAGASQLRHDFAAAHLEHDVTRINRESTKLRGKEV